MKARTLIVTALVPLALAASVARANMPSHRDASVASRAAHANANALVRIDPETNAISRVIGVGSGPIAVAVGRRSIWVYSDSNRKATEIDAATNRVRRSTPVAPRPVDLGHLAGPMLAVDAGGAWLVGIDQQQGPLLTRVPAGKGDTRTYALNVEPRAVAVGAGAVWVLGHRPGDNELIRLNKATGEVTGRTWLPDSGRVDSVAVGRGYAWVMYSATATLYRIDARTMVLGPHADLGQRAGRPRISGGMVWVEVSDAGGRTLLLDGSTLDVVLVLGCCGLRDGHDTVDAFGSNWTTDQQTGTTVRSDGRNYERFTKIHVTEPPRSGGLCETAIVAGAGAVWVAVGQALRHRCGSQLQARTPPYGGIGATVASFNAANQNRPGKPPAGVTYYRVGGTQSGRVSQYHIVVGWTSKRNGSGLLARLTGRELPTDAQMVKPYNGYCAVYRSRWLGQALRIPQVPGGNGRVVRLTYIIVYAPTPAGANRAKVGHWWNGVTASGVPICRG